LNIAHLLNELRSQGIELRPAGADRLVCDAPRDRLTAEIRATIRDHKADILSFLKPVDNGDWSPLVAIQAQGSRPPFFCVHGVGGNVLNYSVFTGYLGPDQPIYGLQSIGLDGLTPPLTDVVAMAAQYVRHVRTVRPRGPYYLGGGSMGGVVAFEMARQLKAEGEEIGLLVLLDTIGSNIVSNGRMPAEKAPGWRGRLARLRHGNPWSVVKAKVIHSWNRSRRFRACRDCLRHNRPIPVEDRFWFIEQSNYTAMYSYVHEKYDGEIVLIRGGLTEDGTYLSDPLRGWTGLANEIRVCPIVGEHETLIEQPELGEVLAKCLREATR
jgi:thioesterase domain-containing protein